MGHNSRRIDCEYTNDAIMTNDGLILDLERFVRAKTHSAASSILLESIAVRE